MLFPKENEGGVLSIGDEGGSTSGFRVANKAGRVRKTATKQNAKKEKGKKETASRADTRVHAPSDAKAYLSSMRDAREYSGG
ncbi:hypothetical protein IGI04_034217 [Brassica rapa subsp. trilocularis]|uniref:Uncharacterized protein n=1 Tax=Brassica rapa subsp. trilocularis TaxID=1813537 RepID=A0ABQ7L838_BRACM|nr:hypothetical protein IGI04_034217 [Brassica rapa subsp. trilocularis]